MRLHTQREYAHHAQTGRDPGTVCRTYGGTDHGTDSNPGTDRRADGSTDCNPGTDRRADRNACSYGSAHNSTCSNAEHSGYRYPRSEP